MHPTPNRWALVGACELGQANAFWVPLVLPPECPPPSGSANAFPRQFGEQRRPEVVVGSFSK